MATILDRRHRSSHRSRLTSSVGAADQDRLGARERSEALAGDTMTDGN